MKTPFTLPDLDRDIYDLLTMCATAGIPISFCGSDISRKWELLAALHKLLRRHEVDSCQALKARDLHTVTTESA